MKDMVRRPQQRYDTLFRELRMQNEAPSGNGSNGARNANDANDANDAMKNELKRYLMELNAPVIEPQPHPQSNSNYIEMGSVYQ